MDERHDDPLAALQRAFAELQPPRPADELHDEDALTRATVGWARGAYDALQPPAPVQRLRTMSSGADAGNGGRDGGGREQRLERTTHETRGERWRRHAAAAVLLMGLGLALRSRPDAPPRLPTAAPVDDRPRLVAVADDHLVMRSGNVRLVLITSTPAAASVPDLR